MTLFYTDTAKISAFIQNTPFSVALFLLSIAAVRLYNILQNSFTTEVTQHSGVNKTPHFFLLQCKPCFLPVFQTWFQLVSLSKPLHSITPSSIPDLLTPHTLTRTPG